MSAGVSQCLAEYPELLKRVDVELQPWRDSGGISRRSFDRLWGCSDLDKSHAQNSSSPDAYSGEIDNDMRKIGGAYFSFRNGRLTGFVESKTGRAMRATDRSKEMKKFMLNLTATFRLPDADLLMVLSDHLDQVRNVVH